MTDCFVLESIFQKHFQKNIKIHLGEKVLRTGKFILFAPKEYYLVFCIDTNGKKKYLEIPLPFLFTEQKEKITFDYSSIILADDITLNLKITEYHKQYKSKYLNNKLVFHFS